METFAGVKGTWSDGVFFTEDSIEASTRRGRVSARISRQNSNLGEVKLRLARDAKAKGANVVMNFTYGQRAHSWWTHIFDFHWDQESWYGEGDAVSVENRC